MNDSSHYRNRPKVCNLCGGEVSFVRNELIYGRPYGSGRAYLCSVCGAYVGTHANSPRTAMGLLADDEMRELRKQCHELFDMTWHDRKERSIRYMELARKMDMNSADCHFAWMDKSDLKRALSLLKEGNDDNG